MVNRSLDLGIQLLGDQSLDFLVSLVLAELRLGHHFHVLLDQAWVVDKPLRVLHVAAKGRVKFIQNVNVQVELFLLADNPEPPECLDEVLDNKLGREGGILLPGLGLPGWHALVQLYFDPRLFVLARSTKHLHSITMNLHYPPSQ